MLESIIKAIGKLVVFVCSNVYYFVLSALDIAFIVIYAYSTRNLIKPSGLAESWRFLWDYHEDFGIALLAGLLAYFITWVLFFSSGINLFNSIIGENDDEKWIVILKIIIGIGLLVASIIFLKGLGSITLLAIGITIGIVLVLQGMSNR